MKKKYNPLPKKHERTVSFSSPRNSRRGCLCKNRNEYSVKCCDGLLVEQGIGNIQAPASCIPVTLEYFVWEISSSFAAGTNIGTATYVDINNVSQSIQYWVQPATVQPSMNYVVSKNKPTTDRPNAIYVSNEFLAPYGTCFQVDVTMLESADTVGSIQPSFPFNYPVTMSYMDCCGVEQTLSFNEPSTQRICVTQIPQQLTLSYRAPIFPPTIGYWSPFRLEVVATSNKPYIVCVP